MTTTKTMNGDEVAGEGLVHHGSAQATCAICQKLTFNAPNWDGAVTCSMPCTDHWITIHEEKEDHDTAVSLKLRDKQSMMSIEVTTIVGGKHTRK